MQKAKKKPIDKKSAKDCGVDLSQAQTQYTSFSEPPKRKGGDKVEDVSQLMAKLKEKGFV